MRPLGIALAFLLALAGPATTQESIVSGLSTDDIALTASFEGSDVFLFGAIRRENAVPPEAGPLDVVLTLSGPQRPLWVRRKERRLGIWVNTDSVRVAQAPSYYAVASTRPVDRILTEVEQLRWGIGMDQAVRRVGGHPTITDTSDFAEAVVRIKGEQELYAVQDRGVELREETLFYATFSLPANLVEGLYVARFFLVRDGKVIHSGDTEITVRKAGLERWIYNLSRRQPLVYGSLAVAMALVTGWLAATATRFVRR